ncbi:UNVERIFIED_CONTAM: hypothetical protein GTU68_048123, partial [Idotea baltica]|nr:hypothetical protein [Idotea baltica]
QVVFQEVEVFSGDSRTSLTEEHSVLADLLPGRNYSVSVFALSNGVESLPVAKYVLTKPASPIFEELQPIQGGLNVSWKSDVTSKQAGYAIIYTRNDTGVPVTRLTEDAHVLLEDLYPGAGYEIKVYAISQAELWSEPHVYFQAICKYHPDILGGLPFNEK